MSTHTYWERDGGTKKNWYLARGHGRRYNPLCGFCVCVKHVSVGIWENDRSWIHHKMYVYSDMYRESHDDDDHDRFQNKGPTHHRLTHHHRFQKNPYTVRMGCG